MSQLNVGKSPLLNHHQPVSGERLIPDYHPTRQSTSQPRIASTVGSRNNGVGRFGQLSYSSFFTRHSPHPNRVKHIKGLLGCNICCVNDDGYIANPHYSMTFPPNNFNQTRLKSYSQHQMLPSGAINVCSSKYSLDTINGLKYFMGKPLNFRIFKEKFDPRIHLTPVTDSWRDELHLLTDAIGFKEPNGDHSVEIARKEETGTRLKTKYSETTGRLIPPPSRAMSRGFSRNQSRLNGRTPSNLEGGIAGELGVDDLVLRMLCQILQTDDIGAVQSWLISSADREKALALELIRAALANNEDYYSQKRSTNGPQDNNQLRDQEAAAFLPKIAYNCGKNESKPIDRLVVHDGYTETANGHNAKLDFANSAADGPPTTRSLSNTTNRKPRQNSFSQETERAESTDTGRLRYNAIRPERQGEAQPATVLRLTTGSGGLNRNLQMKTTSETIRDPPNTGDWSENMSRRGMMTLPTIHENKNQTLIVEKELRTPESSQQTSSQETKGTQTYTYDVCRPIRAHTNTSHIAKIHPLKKTKSKN